MIMMLNARVGIAVRSRSTCCPLVACHLARQPVIYEDVIGTNGGRWPIGLSVTGEAAGSGGGSLVCLHFDFPIGRCITVSFRSGPTQ